MMRMDLWGKKVVDSMGRIYAVSGPRAARSERIQRILDGRPKRTKYRNRQGFKLFTSWAWSIPEVRDGGTIRYVGMRG